MAYYLYHISCHVHHGSSCVCMRVCVYNLLHAEQTSHTNVVFIPPSHKFARVRGAMRKRGKHNITATCSSSGEFVWKVVTWQFHVGLTSAAKNWSSIRGGLRYNGGVYGDHLWDFLWFFVFFSRGCSVSAPTFLIRRSVMTYCTTVGAKHLRLLLFVPKKTVYAAAENIKPTTSCVFFLFFLFWSFHH